MLKSFKTLISATLTIFLAVGVFLSVGVPNAKAAGNLVSGAKVAIVQNTSLGNITDCAKGGQISIINP